MGGKKQERTMKRRRIKEGTTRISGRRDKRQFPMMEAGQELGVVHGRCKWREYRRQPPCFFYNITLYF